MSIPVSERRAERVIAALDFEKLGGLVTVVTQAAADGKVLMLAFASPEAVRRTLTQGWAHYYSRSREEIWKKGESSGHLQRVREVRIDCDGDALLYIVEQEGAACHTGYVSCFYRRIEEDEIRPVEARGE
jgi:phosphoribosyl-AMP cyclohydrolase